MADNKRNVYLNPKQQRLFYARPRHVRLVAARRFGKTDGGLGPRIWMTAESMPQGAGAFLGTSRKQLFSRTVPGVIAAIERFYGFREGTHFGWGRPPKNVPKCIIRPKSYDNAMWFANGHIIHTISLAMVGSVNGMTLNEVLADECKFLPKKKIDEEVMPALSGMVHPMGGERFTDANPLYKSTFFCSDASLTQKGNWLSREEDTLDVKIDGGIFDGKTYREVQEELDHYADRVIFYNDLLYYAKKEGHRVQIVSQATKERISTIVKSIMQREEKFAIIPRQWKTMSKALCDMLLTYNLVTEDDVELIFDYKFLLTHEEHMEMMAIRSSAKYQKHINDLRCNAFYFLRASSLDNIDILGESYIKQMKISLPPLTFALSILNLKPKKSGEGFYCNFDPDIHTYIEDDCPAVNDSMVVKKGKEITGGTAFDTEYESPDFDYLSEIKNCTLDGDLREDLPLEIAFDYNNAINWVVVGQVYRRDGVECLNILNSMFVKNGQMIQDLIRNFDRYYHPHKARNRQINYYYSNTAKFGMYSVSRLDIKDTVISELRKRNWDVNPIDEGPAPKHEAKYQIINSALAGFEYPAIRINRENNEALIAAIEQCDVKVRLSGLGGFGKDKSGEKLSVDAEDAVPEELRTDGTDAFDELYVGVKDFRNSISYVEMPRG